MVTHNAAVLEEHQPLAEESPLIDQQRKRRVLNNEVELLQCIGISQGLVVFMH